MLYEYQCLYAVNGEARSVFVRASTPEAAREILSRVGVAAEVGPGLPVVDWDKPTLNKEEAAAYLDVGATKIWELQCDGLLPQPKRHGHSVFHVRELERYRMKFMRVDRMVEREAAA